MPIPRIAIIGAGPGGLTMANLLQRNGMQCTIFELDENRSSRDQGGVVDLHPEGGQVVLKEAGLFDGFTKFMLPAGEARKLMRKNGEVVWDDNETENEPFETSGERPEIDRLNLRNLLLDSLSPDTIQWNRKLVKVEPAQDGAKYNLHFTDSIETGFDLVIGADGAWSKVRPLLTNELPYYSGIQMVELQAEKVSEKKPWLAKFVGQGSNFMFDEGRALICQNNGYDRIRIYAATRQPETWAKDCGINWEEHDSARKILAELYFGDCHPDIKRAISDEATDKLIVRSLYMLPVGMKWEPRRGVTLLGDAAHLMTPFGGVGVNVAMVDGMSLTHELLKRKSAFEANEEGALEAAVKAYEEEMFPRAKKNMEKTYHGLVSHFSADGIDERLNVMKQRAKRVEQMMKARREAATA